MGRSQLKLGRSVSCEAALPSPANPLDARPPLDKRRRGRIKSLQAELLTSSSSAIQGQNLSHGRKRVILG